MCDLSHQWQVGVACCSSWSSAPAQVLHLLLRRGQLEVPRPVAGEEDSDEAALWRREVAKVERVISHLIVKDGVLVVVQTPEVCSPNYVPAFTVRRHNEE
jgi:hypothetical protein